MPTHKMRHYPSPTQLRLSVSVAPGEMQVFWSVPSAPLNKPGTPISAYCKPAMITTQVRESTCWYGTDRPRCLQYRSPTTRNTHYTSLVPRLVCGPGNEATTTQDISEVSERYQHKLIMIHDMKETEHWQVIDRFYKHSHVVLISLQT